MTHTSSRLGKTIVVKGDVVSGEDLLIDGRVEGTVDLGEHSLTVGTDAHLRADVMAKVVTVLGTVNGTITAHEIVNLCNTARVEGEVASARLVMADGAAVQGRVSSGRWTAGSKNRKPALATAV